MADEVSTPYRVVVTRERDAWLADVPDVAGAHTWARDLKRLEGFVREAIVLALDLHDGAEDDIALEWEYHTGDGSLDRSTSDLRDARRRLTAFAADVADRTQALVADLARKGWSVRDIAGLLGISPQRVSQVKAEGERAARR
jgi:DNA-directed RNA polymerase specialized sigma subunit